MTRIRAAIIDDEPLARRGIKVRLARWPQFEVVAEAGDVHRGMREIERAHPDIVFLDIEMPEGDGFSLIHRLARRQRPLIVFVTAHDHHALAAFGAEAFDYLLKPIDDARFDRTAERIIGRLAPDDATVERLVIRDQGLTIALDPTTVDWVKSDGDYVRIVAGRESYLHHATLSSLEARLPPQRFMRIHRTTIVNIARIRSLEPLTNGDALVRLSTGAKLRLSRTYRSQVIARMGDTALPLR